MKLKYMGPRPVISQHGIQFKSGKEDKYVYLMIALQILKSIDKDYNSTKSYNYDTSTKRLSNIEMIKVINSYENNLDKTILSEEKNYKLRIKKEIQIIKDRTNLKKIEKTAWVNNIKLMSNYRIQRAVNKIYYMHCISHIKSVILRENIKEIDTPFYEKFWHVLQTIQGSLSEGRKSLYTDIKVVTDENGKMISKLFIG
ncbi:MAG: hypothetical protein KAJ49_02695 [Arcobacteraceae bacterium]|nr:hypothetical protein [Arcobacteraceae bacterium]